MDELCKLVHVLSELAEVCVKALEVGDSADRVEALELMSACLATLKDESIQLRAQVLKQLEAPKQVAIIDINQANELRRMNAYLLGELERRQLAAEEAATPRRWWPLWERSTR